MVDDDFAEYVRETFFKHCGLLRLPNPDIRNGDEEQLSVIRAAIAEAANEIARFINEEWRATILIENMHSYLSEMRRKEGYRFYGQNAKSPKRYKGGRR